MVARDRLNELRVHLASLTADPLYPDPSLRWFAHGHPPFSSGDAPLAMLTKSADVDRPGDGAHRTIDIIRVVTVATKRKDAAELAFATHAFLLGDRGSRQFTLTNFLVHLTDLEEPSPFGKIEGNAVFWNSRLRALTVETAGVD